LFLRINGYSLAARDSAELGELVTRVVTRDISDEKFAELIRRFVHPA
jgi:prophage maintenance system killer protein